MKKIIFCIGFALFFLGASGIDDSELLVIPVALIATGLILMSVTKEVLNERD